MADKRITDLDALVEVVGEDLLVVVDSPLVSPINKKVTVAAVVGRNSFAQRVFGVLWGTMEAALTWAAAQVFEAAVSVAATLAGTLLTVNQSGTGDVVTLKDGGVTRVRVPDGGGLVLVPQAGGVSGIDGLMYYDSTAAGFKRLRLRHEGHNYAVPVDGRNGFRNVVVHTTY